MHTIALSSLVNFDNWLINIFRLHSLHCFSIIPVFLHLINFVYTLFYLSKYDLKYTTYYFRLYFFQAETLTIRKS